MYSHSVWSTNSFVQLELQSVNVHQWSLHSLVAECSRLFALAEAAFCVALQSFAAVSNRQRVLRENFWRWLCTAGKLLTKRHCRFRCRMVWSGVGYRYINCTRVWHVSLGLSLRSKVRTAAIMIAPCETGALSCSCLLACLCVSPCLGVAGCPGCCLVALATIHILHSSLKNLSYFRWRARNCSERVGPKTSI